jgi:hypothetical protein
MLHSVIYNGYVILKSNGWMHMNKQDVHQYVIEHITGSLEARQNSKRLLVQSFVFAAVVSLAIFISDPSDSTVLGIALGVLLAGVPFGVMAQRSTLRIALARDYLRLKRFLIGKKGYVAPKSHVLHENSDLFSLACSLVCHEPFFAPHTEAAAWHSHGFLADRPDVAASTGWYGNNNKPVVFLYGDNETMLELAEDIWDLGHVRKFTAADRERYSQTTAGWQRQKLMPVTLAYASIPDNADPANLSSEDVSQHCLLLGSVGLEGSRGYGQNIPLAPAKSVILATETQVILTASLAAYAGLSILLSKLYDKTPLANLAQLLVFSLLIGPLILAVYSWDQAKGRKAKRSQNGFGPLFIMGVFIAGTGIATSLLYEYAQGFTTAADSVIHQSAAAVGLLTFGICLLLQIILSRANIALKKTAVPYNPLFMLAVTSSMLLVLIVTYATGPLLLGGTLMAVGAGLAFFAIHEIRAYSNRHHTRDHIIELLQSTH